MKKIFAFVCICLLGLSVGCKKKEVSLEELNEVNDKIIAFFTENLSQYENYSFNYVDETNHKVVVGLLDNNLEWQEKFLELVVRSEYIQFVKGEALKDEKDFKKSSKEIERCLECQLGAYITTEIILPTDKNLNELIDVPLDNVLYSNVKVNSLGAIFVILKTEDERVITSLDDYFKKNYPKHKKEIFDEAYYIYLDNGYDSFDLKEELKVCN
ncbi:MAG: hypothetical protein HFJ02_04810 [Bacilli bacterium]|nr:hypothetical protein [Bacilli bacterium]